MGVYEPLALTGLGTHQPGSIGDVSVTVIKRYKQGSFQKKEFIWF